MYRRRGGEAAIQHCSLLNEVARYKQTSRAQEDDIKRSNNKEHSGNHYSVLYEGVVILLATPHEKTVKLKLSVAVCHSAAMPVCINRWCALAHRHCTLQLKS